MSDTPTRDARETIAELLCEEGHHGHTSRTCEPFRVLPDPQEPSP